MTYDEVAEEATLSTGRVLKVNIETLAPAGQNLCCGEDSMLFADGTGTDDQAIAFDVDGKRKAEAGLKVPLTYDERGEIAGFMVARWLRWMRTGDTEKALTDVELAQIAEGLFLAVGSDR